jgi:hypothetical protein
MFEQQCNVPYNFLTVLGEGVKLGGVCFFLERRYVAKYTWQPGITSKLDIIYTQLRTCDSLWQIQPCVILFSVRVTSNR